MTPELGPVPDGVNASRRKGPGQQVIAIINSAQEIRHVAPPQQMRALQSRVLESALELLSHGLMALSNHNGESRDVPVIASTNYRHLVERIAE